MLDYKQQQKEAEAIRADMQKAHAIIKDAKDRYIKEKLKAKSKKQAIDAAVLFVDLADYAHKQEIIDYYGGGYITSCEYERLLHLWDMREQYDKDSNKYHDRVIEILNKATLRIGDDYQDFLHEADMEKRENERNQHGLFKANHEGGE